MFLTRFKKQVAGFTKINGFPPFTTPNIGFMLIKFDYSKLYGSFKFYRMEGKIMLMIDKEEIMKQTGFTKSVAGRIIREAKQEMVRKGYNFYANKRLSRVPLEIVNHLLAVELQGSEYIGNVPAKG